MDICYYVVTKCDTGGAGMDAANTQATLNAFMSYFTFAYYGFYGLISVATFILMALSLFTIARRRFLRSAWLAWIPFTQFWVLGRIADDYQWTARYRNKKKRIVLLVLNIIQLAALLLLVLGFYRIISVCISEGVTDEEKFTTMLSYIQSEMGDPYHERAAWAQKMFGVLTRNTNLIIFSTVVMVATAVTHVVFYYMALYDLYRSCDPDNATVFLVFSILFGITIPIFMMICRKQDKGLHYKIPNPGFHYQYTQ